jgi:CHAD domain-containing protein
LHQFRIAGKKLRYSMELLAPAFGSELREKQYPIVQELQDKLGSINDYVAGRDILQRLCEKNSNAEAKDQFTGLIGKQESSRDAAIAEFRGWWTRDRAESLRQGLV